MLGNRKLILDTFCEVYDLLRPMANAEFWDFEAHKIIPGAVYLIGRKQFTDNVDAIKKLAQAGTILPILSNPAEGSETMFSQIHRLGIETLVDERKILILAGGFMPDRYPYLYYENFLPKILDYSENLSEISQGTEQIFSNTVKPYNFLFLNGRARPHRRYLITRLAPLLDSALWTNLDSSLCGSKEIKCMINGQDQLLVPGKIKLLDKKYEFDFYQENMNMTDLGFVKNQLFNNQWGEIYIKAAAYIDTYFSLVTETIFFYPYSFRTEKIWKPIAIGHPFVAVANNGYYRDLHNIGFRTFGHVIDESFDQIENNQDRINRIVQVVEDLCQQDLASFLKECYNVCKYNQQHLAEMRTRVRKDFPARFLDFLAKHP